MKEVSKVEKIYKGFFGEELPEAEAEVRRKICAGCEYNSKNAKDMSLANKIRSKVMPPFCTLCDCQIHEKTGSALEECAAYMNNEPKKWFKIKIETMEKEDLNLTQLGDTKYDIQIEGNSFVVDLGLANTGETPEVELLFEGSAESVIDYNELKVSCGCVSAKGSSVRSNAFQVNARVNIKQVGYGAGVKTITLYYTQNAAPRKLEVKLKYFRQS